MLGRDREVQEDQELQQLKDEIQSLKGLCDEDVQDLKDPENQQEPQEQQELKNQDAIQSLENGLYEDNENDEKDEIKGSPAHPANIRHRRLKPYLSNQQNRASSVQLPFGSRALLLGSVIAAAFDGGTYALGYGGGAVAAITLGVVTFGVALPLAIAGVWFKYREYKTLQSDINVVIETERVLYRDILSNTITNFKRLNLALSSAIKVKANIDQDDFKSIVAQFYALEARLQAFQPKKTDAPEMKKFKEDITSVYPDGVELARLEKLCIEDHLKRICRDQNWDLHAIRKDRPASVLELPVKKEDQAYTIWKYLLGFAYALGTIITVAFMAGVMATLVTIPGGVAVLGGALLLAYIYKKLEDKFTALQNNLTAMTDHFKDQAKLQEADQSMNNVATLCRNLSKAVDSKPARQQPSADSKSESVYRFSAPALDFSAVDRTESRMTTIKEQVLPVPVPVVSVPASSQQLYTYKAPALLFKAPPRLPLSLDSVIEQQQFTV